MMIISAAGFIAVMSCDNTNRNNDNTQERHGDDTTDVYDKNRDNDADGFGKHDRNNNNNNNTFNNRRDDTDGIYDDAEDGTTDDQLRSRGNTGSTSELDGNNATTSNDLPQEIKNKLQNDEAFRNMRLSNSRSYEKDGKTYYEITLEEKDGNNLDRSNTTTGDSRNRPIDSDNQ